jgi:hypothetical protein
MSRPITRAGRPSGPSTVVNLPDAAGVLRCCIGAGLLIGRRLAEHLAPARVRQAVIVLAFAGALATIVKAVVGA